MIPANGHIVVDDADKRLFRKLADCMGHRRVSVKAVLETDSRNNTS